MTPPMQVFNPSALRHLALLDRLDQSAIATTADGVIVDWNVSAETLYGWSRDEALGRNVVDLVPSAMSRDEAARIMRALAAGEIWSGEFPVRTRAGESFLASVTDVPILGEDDRIAGVVGLSARSTRLTTPLASLLARFGEACTSLWPARLNIALPRSTPNAAGSEPHILQLLAVIVLRYGNELQAGEPLDISARPADSSVFADFGLRAAIPAAYLRFSTRAARSWSVIRDEIQAARPTNFAAALVRAIGGWLFVESAGTDAPTTHLLLPLTHAS